MALDWQASKFLIWARQSGVNFARTATLGRQNLEVSHRELAQLFHEFDVSQQAGHELPAESSEYADEFFAALGAQQYMPIDASEYEGAAEIHDMNQAIPARLNKAFDTVVDGGTLEHVFNFPRALQNCMEMVRVGGHLLLVTPANNFCGHGFYQFSPELFYRALSAENGYAIERMLAYEVYPRSTYYEVADPAQVGARVELLGSDHRVLLLVRARRTADMPVFARTPQQSDYVATWNSANANGAGGEFGVRNQPGVFRRLGWRALGLCGVGGKRASRDRRVRYLNRQLRIDLQPGVFRAVEK